MSDDVLGMFEAANFRPTGGTRNFALKIEGFDLSGRTHFVVGTDLSDPDQPRVKVFLRDLGDDKTRNRPSIWHYATNPYASLTEADYRNQGKMQAISNSLEAKCYTAPGGVLMIQGAFNDSASGAISASWINRLAEAGKLKDGEMVILPCVMASMSTPRPSRKEGKPPYASVTVVHDDKGVVARSTADFNQVFFNSIATSPTAANGKLAAAIKMVNIGDRRSSVKMIERGVVPREDQDGYDVEAPANTVERFWSVLGQDNAARLRAHLDERKIEILVYPATTWRIVGDTAKELSSPVGKRQHLPYEKFQLAAASEDEVVEAGYRLCAVTLWRHKPANGEEISGGENFSVGSIYPLSNKETPVALKQLPI